MNENNDGLGAGNAFVIRRNHRLTMKSGLVMKTCLALLLFFLAHFSPAPTFAAEPAASAPAAADQDKQYKSVEERRLMESLQKEGRAPFAQEREDLENKKKELKRLESEVDKKIEQLNQLRVRVEKLLEQKAAEEQKRTLELARMYEKMTAEKAAVILGSIDQELAIAILAKMKTKSAAKILNNMEREKAAKLTTAFSTLDTR